MAFTFMMLLIWLGISIFTVVAVKGICLCVFNDNYGFTMQGVFAFSTEWTRKIDIKKVCGDGQICHLYTTLPQNANTDVFVNVHSGLNLNNLTIEMADLNTKNVMSKISSQPISL